jgi:hypothetical protein
LEQLEDRITPTTLNLIGSSMLISNIFVVDVTPTGGIMATVNGITNTYDAGVYDAIDIFPETSAAKISIYNTDVPVSMENQGFADFIDLGNTVNGVQGIKATIDVTNAPPSSTLDFEDVGDSVGRTAFITGNSVTGLAPAPIFFNNLSQLIVGGNSSGNSTYVVTDTTRVPVDLETTSNDNVYVQAMSASASLAIFHQGGYGTVTVGSDAASLNPIQGQISVANLQGLVGLFVLDQGTVNSQTYTISNSINASDPWAFSRSDAADITYNAGVSLSVVGGSGGNSFDILSTSTSATTIETGTGNDFVHVQGTTGGLNVNNPGGNDTVTIGADVVKFIFGFPILLGRTMANINGSVDVYGAGSTSLYVDDSADTLGTSGSMFDGVLTGLSPSPILWTPSSSPTGGVTYLNVQKGAIGYYTGPFTIFDTSNLYYGTYLLTQGGAVFVMATSGPIYIDGGNGTGGNSQEVIVGEQSFQQFSQGSLANIRGLIDVFNSDSSGYTTLTIDDGADPNSQTANLYDGAVTGLAPAPIDWTPYSGTSGGVFQLAIYGGSGANTFNVFGTSNFVSPFPPPDVRRTFLSTGYGHNTVNILATNGPLAVAKGFSGTSNQITPDTDTIGSLAPSLGGTLANIKGSVLVTGLPTFLRVDDSDDTAGQTATLATSGSVSQFISLTGLSPAPISWLDSDQTVTIYGGSGGNSFNVLNTGSSATLIHSGLGNDFVHIEGTTGPLNVDNTGGNDTVTIGADVVQYIFGIPILLGRTLVNINGPVDVYGAGSTSLYVDDTADTTGPNGSMYDGELAGLSPAPIFWTPSANPTGGVTYLNVKCGTTTANPPITHFAVFNTSNLYSGIYLLSNSDSAPGAGHGVTITGTTGAIFVDGGYGRQTVDIGNNTPINFGQGSVANIQGFVDVFNSGSSGYSFLLVDDGTDLNSQTVNLYDGKITGLAPAPIYWTPNSTTSGGVANLAVIAGSGANTFNVFGTSNFISPPLFSPTETDLVTGGGLDTVNVQATGGILEVDPYSVTTSQGSSDTVTVGSLAPSLGGTLANINGLVVVDSRQGSQLIVDDSGDSTGRAATLTTDSTIFPNIPALIGMAPAAIEWTPINANLPVAVYAGNGNDSLTVSTMPGNPVSLNGGGGTNSLIGPNVASTFFITAPNSGSVGNVSFSSVQNLTGGATNDTFSFQTGGSLTGSVNGGGGLNTVVGPDSGSTFRITAANGGTIDSTTFSSIQNLVGGAGNDTFAFGVFGSLSGKIEGGGGTNTLDYSSFVGTVFVDLPLKIATAITGGISRIQNVTGSIGNDLIVGDANANVLVGGTGRNIIIGGAGPDQITGGGGDNILIGGTTLWDANTTALNAIFQAWTNTAVGFDQRVNALRQGIVVGGKTYALNSSTVHPDNSPDSLIGGGGRNWFFIDFDDVIDNGAGPGPNDRVTKV